MTPKLFNLPRRDQAALPAGQQVRQEPVRGLGNQALALVGWLALCLAASGTAVFVSTDGWYAGLHKPAWKPPPWVFGPVWILLYVMTAVAAWLVWREGGWGKQSWALGLFFLQWLLNALWTPLFFGMHRSGLAFAEIIVLWLVLAATMRSFWRARKPAGVLLAPYLAWVSFALEFGESYGGLLRIFRAF